MSEKKKDDGIAAAKKAADEEIKKVLGEPEESIIATAKNFPRNDENFPHLSVEFHPPNQKETVKVSCRVGNYAYTNVFNQVTLTGKDRQRWYMKFLLDCGRNMLGQP